MDRAGIEALLRDLPGRTIEGGRLIEHEGGDADLEELVLRFTDGEVLSIQSADLEGYCSWLVVEDRPRSASV